MTSGTIISGDSHVIEPSELWTKPLGAKYGDAVPHIIKEFNGEKAEHFFTGIEYIRIDKSCIINCDARREWAPYQDKIYDPFWACAQELDQPVTLHIITGNEVDEVVEGDEELQKKADRVRHGSNCALGLHGRRRRVGRDREFDLDALHHAVAGRPFGRGLLQGVQRLVGGILQARAQ
jgi:hypothetical protein